jgi:hypothetical protein
MAASLKFLLQGGVGDFFAVARAHLHFYRKIPLLKRKRSKQNRGFVGGIYRKNIAVQHYLLGKKKFSELNPTHFS